MLYMSRAGISRRTRRWMGANRPIETPDDPVRRYPGNRSVGPGSRRRESRWALRPKVLRPAF